MQHNPFASIDARLSKIEHLLIDIKHNRAKVEHEAHPPLTRQQAAQYLGISLPTLDTLISTKQIKSFRIGRSVRISREDIEGYVNKKGALI